MLGIFCTRNCCPFGGDCGNGTLEPPKLRLVRDTTLGGALAILAAQPIEKGVVVGEYLGQWTLEPPPPRTTTRHRGYRLAMRQTSKQIGQRTAYIDAEEVGGPMRFVAQSCEPTARLYQVANGTEHKILVATIRELAEGDEVTVDYGDALWFDCHCGRTSTCRHIQHLPPSA